ncbi:MAG TPA: hypothetical protein VH414_18355 [Lichenihabitans sp.]|jgi:hypothetical protein|nr:hypothetical protein [Lichenihabitans sp.]
MDSGSKRVRKFSQAARAAAAEARRRRTAERGPIDEPGLFVVRDERLQRDFRWEIRKYGGVVVEMSAETFDSPRHARSLGEKALRLFLETGRVDRPRGTPEVCRPDTSWDVMTS